MKPSVLFCKSDQPKKLSKREDKKKVNIKWDSRLFFQLGVIASLTIVLVVIESTIGLKVDRLAVNESTSITEPTLPTYVVEIPNPTPTEVVPVEPDKPREKQVPINNNLAVTTNNSKVAETPLASTDAPIVSETPVKKDVPVVDSGPKNIINVEFVPIFPGCESLSSNFEKRACMSEKISAFIAKKFNVDKFSYMDSGKLYRIAVQFRIDENGNVTDIMARAATDALEKEAIKVIGKLPRMSPGRQGDRPVSVLYAVPISFKTYE